MLEFIVIVVVLCPSRCNASDTSHKVAASTHVYMYRSTMWYKRGGVKLWIK